jgi:broad specificity phosphatase PhoE
LHNFEFDSICCSDLLRTKQTLKEFIKFSNLNLNKNKEKEIEILLTPNLREKSGGIFEGRPLSEYYNQLKVNKNKNLFYVNKIKSEK